LAYIYGYPDFERYEDKDLAGYMTVFVGVMLGNDEANNALRQISKSLVSNSANAADFAPAQSKTTLPDVLMKQIGKWLGISITKRIPARLAVKTVPLLGAITSGALTFATFSSETGKLKEKLREEFKSLQ